MLPLIRTGVAVTCSPNSSDISDARLRQPSQMYLAQKLRGW